MLFIFPPVGKPCEPPAGVALLSAALKSADIGCRVYDANAEGLLWLIRSVDDSRAKDSWTLRALKHREQIIADLKDPRLYRNMDRYHQRVYDLNRLLMTSVDGERFRITLSDYADNQLSSVDSKALLRSAAEHRENPFYPFFEEKIRPQIEGWDSPWVGISLCYLNQALVSFALAGWIRENFPEKKLVMGGGLISSWMARPAFDNPFSDLIDVMIKGEGEQPLLELLGGGDTTRKHYVPDYGFADTHEYLAPGRILPFRASIGCYWSKCRFCPEKAETRPYSAQRAACILEDLDEMTAAHRPDVVHFIDNAVTPAFLRALAGREFSFKWYGFVRFEKDFTDPEFCRALKKSGCEMLKLGLESGDQDVLNRMNKGTDLSDVSQTLKNLKAAGILTFVYLLFGTSFEDEAAARRTLGYIKEHQENIDYLNLAVFNLPKFSEDAKGLTTRDFYHGDLSLYLNFDHPAGWDRRHVKAFIDKEFKKELGVGSRFRKNPVFFSSNHAMFFNDLETDK
ncbi:MAG TPA: radical SAM protein [Desulfobacteraceae bacterium]|nr:radical SAM protein [Desulfobacteraceae bacterium]